MSLDALRETFPDYAKDIKLNLGSLANETVLSEQQKWGAFLACAHAIAQCIGTGQQILCLDEQRFARLREIQGARRSPQKLHTQLALKQRQRLTHGGLGHG